MQTPEELMQHIEKCLSGIEGEPGHEKVVLDCGLGAELIRARDAEWQARVDKLETTIKLQENMLRIYNEEFTKQGHRLFLVQARVEKLEAALDYAIACLPDAPLNAKEKLRAALGRE